MKHERRDVVVIGAGFAGLIAASRIHAAGHSVVVLEARDRVGGRAHTVQTRHGSIDLGATWFWPNEGAVAELIRASGTRWFPQYDSGSALVEGPDIGLRRLPGNPLGSGAMRFSGGAAHLAERVAMAVPDDSLLLGSTVTRIDVKRDGVRVRTASDAFLADHVVVALPPALAEHSIRFSPPLPVDIALLARRTPVWMGQTVKAVAVYDQPFWIRRGLAGTALSSVGGFREIHDHCGENGEPAALFGFAPADRFRGATTLEVAEHFQAQLTRMFGDEAALPLSVHVVDWSNEHLTSPPPAGGSAAEFGHELYQSPTWGRVHWASTETSPAFAGHIEGAILAGARAGEACIEAIIGARLETLPEWSP